MSNTAILWTCLIAIVICIVVSFKWEINIGIMAMSYAFLIGCLGQEQTAVKVCDYWPDNLTFLMIASALLYGFARENGTLTVFGSKVLWKFRKHIKLIPWVMFFVAAVMGFLDAGPGTIVLIFPIDFAIFSTDWRRFGWHISEALAPCYCLRSLLYF